MSDAVQPTPQKRDDGKGVAYLSCMVRDVNRHGYASAWLEQTPRGFSVTIGTKQRVPVMRVEWGYIPSEDEARSIKGILCTANVHEVEQEDKEDMKGGAA